MLADVPFARLEHLWELRDKRDRIKELQGQVEEQEWRVEWESEFEDSKRIAWQEGRRYTLIDQSIPNFATPFRAKVDQLKLTPPKLTRSKFCDRCETTLTYGMGRISQPDPQVPCGLCYMMPQLAEQLAGNHHSEIRITRSEVYFLLLREWLADCRFNHAEHRDIFSEDPELPTRVLDVRDRNMLYLLCTKRQRGRYIALSHCWGKAKTFSTTRENLSDFCNGIKLEQLPKTFQDAVEVTQKLGISFLWIDSLCIIQNDRDDWKRESKRMESVFSSAYCTIAATSAKDCNEGFLQRSAVERSIPHSDKHAEDEFFVHVSSMHDEFNRDVESGVLNQRAWVFQERALSRRIIHFTARQTYWECGAVIRSEGLSDSFRTLNWIGDSNFPQTASRLLPRISNSMFEDIFVHYSKLDITKLEDRPVAIRGLEVRLGKFYKTSSTYGVLVRFLHRSLLWQRSGRAPMQPIQFQGKKVPSWSWMAYSGVIRYGAQRSWHQSLKLQWSNNVELDAKNCRIVARLAGTLRGCRIEVNAYIKGRSRAGEGATYTNCRLTDAKGGLVGWITFDEDAKHDVRALRCIVIGKDRYGWQKYAGVNWDNFYGGFYYVLLVGQSVENRKGSKEVQRLGVAVISTKVISDEDRGRIVYVV